MAIKINKKIKTYSVEKPEERAKREAQNNAVANPEPVASSIEPMRPVSAEVIHMHEQIERPEVLIGSTYKIKSPLFEHALYVTVNDIVLNQGSAHELRRPFEIFINSKNMDHFQWIVALTRIMSAVFRKGGDVTFLVEELKAVFDPRGGYFKAGGVYMSSIVAEIGVVIEEHMKMIGLIKDPEMSEAAKKLIAEKRAAYDNQSKKNNEISPPPNKTNTTFSNDFAGVGASTSASENNNGDFPPSATLCLKCNTKATIIMDGCATCLNCGYSKCG